MASSVLKRTTQRLSVEQIKELISYAKSQQVAELKVDEVAFRFAPNAFLALESGGAPIKAPDYEAKKQAEDFNNLLFMSSR